MSFNSPQKYTQIYSLASLTGEHFLILAQEAAQKLGWNHHYINQSSFLAHVPSRAEETDFEIQITIEDDKACLQSESSAPQKTEEDGNRQNIEILLQTIEELHSTIQPEEISKRSSELSSTLHLASSGPSEDPVLPSDHGWLWVFVPVEGYFVTPVLILLNSVIFIAMALAGVGIFEPDTDSLIQWGANFKPYTLDHEWWRLITCTFIHIGIFHLLMNMYALMFIGALLEPFLGRVRFMAAYLLTGLIASLQVSGGMI